MPSAGIDPTALVRITGKADGGHGTGFIIRHTDDGTYILTCRHVVDEVTSQDDRVRVVVIDEKYDAEPIFYPPDNGGPDLAVLLCTAPELRARQSLQLGQPTLKMDPYILSYQRTIGDPEEGPDLNPYTLVSPLPPKFKLRNHPDHRIIHGHSGSPVIDYNTHFVIGVVTEVTQFSTAVTDERDAVIIATSVEQLAPYWSNMPVDLIAKIELALPVDLAPESVFFSYNSSDRATVRQLAAHLEHDGIHVWMDVLVLKAGDDWARETELAFARSDIVAIFVGPSGIGAQQSVEVQKALARKGEPEGERFRLIPVLLPDARTALLPPPLSRYFWVDFRDSLDNPEAYSQLKGAIRERSVSPAPSQHRVTQVIDAQDLVILPELLFRLVARLRERPEMLHSLDATAFWAAVRKFRPSASSIEDLRSVNAELSSEPVPGALWTAWMLNTRATELTALLQHPDMTEAI